MTWGRWWVQEGLLRGSSRSGGGPWTQSLGRTWEGGGAAWGSWEGPDRQLKAELLEVQAVLKPDYADRQGRAWVFCPPGLPASVCRYLAELCGVGATLQGSGGGEPRAAFPTVRAGGLRGGQGPPCCMWRG